MAAGSGAAGSFRGGICWICRINLFRTELRVPAASLGDD